jgi:deoxyribodipyrimidine photo-lyase
MRAIHWFRSDLRLTDNTGLTTACAKASEVLPLYVLDDALVSSAPKAKARLRFMLQCLRCLDRRLRSNGSALVVRRGDPREIVPRVARQARASVVTWNRDYSAFAKRRDAAVEQALAKVGVSVCSFKDRVVRESGELHTRAGNPYTVYTPYRKAWWRDFEPTAGGADPSSWLRPPVPDISAGELPSDAQLNVDDDTVDIPRGGESYALNRLDEFLNSGVKDYGRLRDLPAVDGTSRLSPYLRFGVVSIRECFRQAQMVIALEPGAETGAQKWMDELVWREFYHAILDAFPHVGRGSFRREYDALAWENREDWFAAWCEGRTGYPFVDAAMRQLNATGWMHNRARMVVASFLTKDLLVDWRWGERYFMSRLVDGDPASNNGGWQWAASTGTDAQPYFRVFNPVTQGERFDRDGNFVRRWVPELSDVDARNVQTPGVNRYAEPIVDHAVQRQKALVLYKSVRG